jgi:hypothetical protein
MLIAHLVVLTWKDDVTPERVAQLDEELSALPGKVPVRLAYSHGANLRLRAPAGDYGICAIIDDSDLEAYLDHPAHGAVLGGALGDMISERTSVQIPITDELAELITSAPDHGRP